MLWGIENCDPALVAPRGWIDVPRGLQTLFESNIITAAPRRPFLADASVYITVWGWLMAVRTSSFAVV
jgi:hypothetical protein